MVETTPSAPGSGHAMRVLIVDDSQSMRRVTASMLSELGFTDVVDVADGSQALRAVGGSAFDLILMDWKMPGLSGLDTLQRLKADPASRGIPVIMVTSEASKFRILKAVQAGAAGYIIKPFSEEILKEKISPFLKLDRT